MELALALDLSTDMCDIGKSDTGRNGKHDS